MANPYQPQGDKTDYLMSVLCVIKVLDVLTLPLTAIVGIFWVKKYQLPMMGEGFSTKINAKKNPASFAARSFRCGAWIVRNHGRKCTFHVGTDREQYNDWTVCDAVESHSAASDSVYRSVLVGQ